MEALNENINKLSLENDSNDKVNEPVEGKIQEATASLYVGELAPSVNEATLFEVFSPIGQVSSIRVCRDAVTKKSLGYAYVNYSAVQDGEKAIEDLNYSIIDGKPCRIMWSQRDPSTRRSGDGNIFIKNLHPAIDNKALHDTFSAFGKILSCKVSTDENGNSRCFGFVHYEDAESANAAIESVNGMLLNDREVYVAKHESKEVRESKKNEIKANFTNVYIKNLAQSLSEDEIKKLFEPFGEITSFHLEKDSEGTSKGFAFINFENHDAAQKSIDELNDKEVEGLKLYVGRAQKKSERSSELRESFEKARIEKAQKYQGINLYIKNLDESVDSKELEELFQEFGQITSAKVMVYENGKSRGFGFVCFTTPEEATKAISQMNQKLIKNKPIYVALAQRKDVRRSQLEQQIQARNTARLASAHAGLPGQFIPPMFYGANGPYPPQMMRMRGQFPNQPVPMYMPPQFQQPQMRAPQPPVDEKRMLGEQLYPRVIAKVQDPEAAGKITGMMLGLETEELLQLLQDEDLFQSHFDDALKAYEDFKNN
ncbi:unnamed protein product [Candida verbasci]|uniref:Polyadenylate-binding protein n=1 Tax=Candida verbasci TaxID=1227364 RepID=A0A9W4TVZ1_9ASCO|nr:unnamed protein product [Candida verbasci]